MQPGRHPPSGGRGCEMKPSKRLFFRGWACAFVIVTVPLTRGETHTVSLLMDRFDPPAILIRAGDTVHWVWIKNFHNVESGTVDGFTTLPDGRFRSGDPDAGLEFSLTFDAEFLSDFPAANSLYPYYCAVHYFEGMTATVEVVVPGDANLDTVVDLDDLPVFAACFLGPDEFGFGILCPPQAVMRLDTDEDGDVDLRDIADFQNAMSPRP